jgi:hypothetical protein
MMEDARARDTGRLAIAVGTVAAGSAISLATYFVAQGPFGTINDIGNAATGVLSACLAWRLRDRLTGRTGDVALAAAMAGGAITVLGSALVVFHTTGFFLAGLVSSVGFAGIGAWLVALNRRAGDAGWTRRVRTLGMSAGALMMVGILAAPGIALRLDDAATAPLWAWIGGLGWLSTYVVYPAWAIWLGMLGTRRARRGETHVEVPSWTRG